MTDYIINGAISVGASLAANKISASFGKRKSKKQHVVCRLIGTPEDETSEKAVRTDTSNSDYTIEFYNLSEHDIVADYFEISDNNKIIVGSCLFGDDQQRIAASSKIQYILMEQDADALEWHIKQEKLKECGIILHTIDDKEIKIKLVVESILLRLSIQEEIDGMCVD